MRSDADIPVHITKVRRRSAWSARHRSVGFRPLDRIEANLFFRVVSARYDNGSIILTSTEHVRDWPEIFAGDDILTTAILDRLLHHVHILHIDGRSHRLREIDGLLKQPASDSRGSGGERRTA